MAEDTGNGCRSLGTVPERSSINVSSDENASSIYEVGGSSWRPRIDHKRPQEKKKHDLKEDRTR